MGDNTGFYSAAQLRELERRAIAAGVSGYTLMQRAAAAGFRELTRRWPKTHSLAVVCGSGNNGGDGYEMARLAHAAGMTVRVFQVSEEAAREEAAQARKAWLADGGKVEPYRNQSLAADVIVDAIFGIGLSRAPEGPAQAAILAINAAHDRGAGVLAVDVPSGLDADRGGAPGDAVRADLTVTFIGRKLGLHSDLAGQVVFDSLQIPPQVCDGVPAAAAGLTPDYLKQVLPRRRRNAHKGDMGHVLIVGGDESMGGAALMAASAALRAGAGLVSVATRALHCAALTAAQPELMCHALEEPRKLRGLIERATVLAIGPGLGRGEWGRAMWAQAQTASQPLVVDADGLNWLADQGLEGPAQREDWVLTPHPGEAARLLDRSTAQVQADRVAAVQALRKTFGGVAVLKGAGTLVQGEALALCPHGNPGMAVGGMGDVLCGVIAGLMAQGLGCEVAARAGVLAHALAGDRAAAAGERGTLPGDLLNELRPLLNP
jgi:NAD(P)H-hydrate epimerase